MASSMTGFGRAESANEHYKFTVEISTVNNRFLEYSIRLPKSLSQLENSVRTLLSGRFNRGKINVAVNWEQEQSVGAVILDEARADAYFHIYQLLKERYALKDDLSIRDFASLPDLVKIEQKENNIEQIWSVLQPAVEAAANATAEMRNAEGANLARDMLERTANIKRISDEIEKLSPENVKAYHVRLQARIQELLQNVDFDEQRAAMEVALWAEKSDINEECIRLRSHLEQFDESLRESGPVGKKLNFLLQELNREANTTGDKAAYYEISKRVIILKEEIERLREQVQNIE